MNITIIKTALRTVSTFAQKNAPALAAGLAIAAGAIAIYETAKATLKAEELVKKAEDKKNDEIRKAREAAEAEKAAKNDDESDDIVEILDDDDDSDDGDDVEAQRVPLTKKEKIKAAAPAYVKAAIFALVSCTATIASVYFGNRQIKAAVALATATEAMLSDHIKAEKELFGEKKAAAVADKVNENRVFNANLDEDNIINTGYGTTVCVEVSTTGQPFYSDIEHIRQAINTLNEMLLNQEWVTLNDYYDALGFKMSTKLGEDLGWAYMPEYDKGLIKVRYTSVLLPSGKPALAVELENLPSSLYNR